jgi:hypothetical protein
MPSNRLLYVGTPGGARPDGRTGASVAALSLLSRVVPDAEPVSARTRSAA